jgi:hypothetical protein
LASSNWKRHALPQAGAIDPAMPQGVQHHCGHTSSTKQHDLTGALDPFWMIVSSCGTASSMPKRSPLYQLRSILAGLFGISDERARNGVWWEIDFIIVLLLGAFGLGAYAWTQL